MEVMHLAHRNLNLKIIIKKKKIHPQNIVLKIYSVILVNVPLFAFSGALNCTFLFCIIFQDPKVKI